MPFKSQAQRRKFAQLLVEGKISNETFEEWNRETGGRRLPERVKRQSRTKSAKTAKTARRTSSRKRR
jgi:CRISPR/Cas system-associated endonuclease Cas1